MLEIVPLPKEKWKGVAIRKPAEQEIVHTLKFVLNPGPTD